MPVTVPVPQAQVRYVRDDGTLTPEGIALMQAIVRALKDHETRLPPPAP